MEVPANTYLCPIETPGACLLIDPGSDRAAIQAALDEHGLTPIAVYCTHGHFDHLGSAEHFQRRYSIPVRLHPADEKLARAANFRMLALKLSFRIDVPEVFEYIEVGQTVDGIGGSEIVGVPGHSPGSVVLRIAGHAFTGDTLYRDDVWRVPWPEQDEEGLIASMRRMWERLPDETLVYPGHGGSERFGAIKLRNLPMRRLLGVDEVATP
jgi:glyoxylase-like metal-dependent hydrolase (beta-lactamase superfamily II)